MQGSSIQYVLLGIIFIFYACSPKNEIYDLVIDTNTSMQANISFKTSLKSHCKIDYWEEGTNTIRQGYNLSTGKSHRIILLDLNPNTIYEYKINIDHDGNIMEIGHQLFKSSIDTVMLPDLDLVVDKGDIFDGYLLVKRNMDPGIQVMIDNKGEVVWYHKFDTIVERPYFWTVDGTIITINNERHIIEYDISGSMIFELEYGEKGFTELLHHEIFKDKAGNILSLSHINRIFDLSYLGGSSADTVKGDGIRILDSSGNLKWEWDIFEHLDPMTYPDINDVKDDWSHANSLNMDQNGNYLVSFRNFSQVWCIDSKSGEVLWKLGMGGDFQLDKDDIFLRQHAAHINKHGELMLFDNGSTDRSYSRALSFELDVESMTAKTNIKVVLPDSLFSFKQGSAYLLHDDKVLFSCTMPRKIAVTDFAGNILWQLNSSNVFYRAIYIDKKDFLN